MKTKNLLQITLIGALLPLGFTAKADEASSAQLKNYECVTHLTKEGRIQSTSKRNVLAFNARSAVESLIRKNPFAGSSEGRLIHQEPKYEGSMVTDGQGPKYDWDILCSQI